MESLISSCSDHRPLIVICDHIRGRWSRNNGLFRYEASWELEEECSQKVAQFWNQSCAPKDPLQRVQFLLLACQKGLKQWSIRSKKGRQSELNTKSNKLKVLLEKEGPEVMEDIKILQKEIHHWMDQEELKWRQRAKQHWYKHGDRNTKYFHVCANQRRAKNHIKYIVDE